MTHQGCAILTVSFIALPSASLAVVLSPFALSVDISQLILIMANRWMSDSTMACYYPRVDGLATSVPLYHSLHLFRHICCCTPSHFASLSRTLSLFRPHQLQSVQVPSTIHQIATALPQRWLTTLLSRVNLLCRLGNRTQPSSLLLLCYISVWITISLCCQAASDRPRLPSGITLPQRALGLHQHIGKKCTTRDKAALGNERVSQEHENFPRPTASDGHLMASV